MKRGLDLALTLAALPVVLPVCLGVAGWLAATRRTPVLVRRQVIGRSRSFAMLTFPAESVLRRLHVWRLPALYHVLRGDLSLVGPRPIQQAMKARYLPWQMMLTSVRPGLMGPWWLVSGSERISITAEVGLDLAYIRNYTIWSDLRLLVLVARRLAARARASADATTEAATAADEEKAVSDPMPAAISGGTR